MHKIILVTGLLISLTSFAYSQCPTAAFTLPDSICAGSSFQVTSTSTSGASHSWDLCPGELNTVPQSSLLSSFAGLNFPQQLRFVTDNGNHYLFVANLLGSNLLRYDFGTSIDNIPVVYDYGSIGGLLSLPAGIDVINEGGNWYALISNIGNASITRVDLGNAILNNSATGVSLGLFSLADPRGVKIAKDGSDYYAFISNAANNDLTKINFGSSISNVPSGFSALTDPAFDVPWGFDVAFDCTIGKWIGFYASNAQSKLNVIDFGTTLANPGTLVSSISCIDNPSGINLVHEGLSWYLLLNSFTNSQFQKIRIDGSLLTVPTALASYVVPQNVSPRNVAYYNDSTGFHVFISNNQPSTINKLLFTTPCSASPLFSNNSSAIAVTSSLNNDYQLVSLSINDSNGLSAYFTDSVYISEAPQAAYVYSAACEGQLVIFADSSILNTNITTTWTWDFGDASPVSTDQNPVHLFPGTGTYFVTLTVTYPTGCNDVYSDSIYVAPLPDAVFSFQNNQCSFSPVSFTDLSQSFAGTVITTWAWDFGDNSTDSIQNPSHTFTAAGLYTVFLQVTTNNGCVDTISLNITIIPSPVAGFEVTSTCIGETVSFIDTTSIQGSIQINYNWDFGDADTSILQNPVHQYAAVAGNYDVTLIATAINGCSDSLVENIRISNKPVAEFSWSPLVVCVGNTINFTSTSSGTGGDTISVYLWDFGDGNSSNAVNPMYAYSDTGFYDVMLTVVSPTNCDSSVTQQIYVIPSPTASFTVAGVCLGLTTIFNPITTTPPTTQIDSIVWTFGDGNGFTGLTSPTYTYLTPGKFGVSMTVYNNLLCTAIFTDSVAVYPLPLANYTYAILCSDSAATFNGGSSSVLNDSITSWVWDFNGLGVGTGSTTAFTFQNAGNYDVTLIVTTSNGCTDTSTQQVSVIQSPEFDFIFNEPCFGLPSSFTYIPNILPAPNAILTWDFGNGSSASILNPSHVYGTVDTFTVSLRVQHNATGCASTVLKNLIVKPYPNAGFSFINNCENLPLQFTDTSIIIAGTISSWQWDFGNLGTSNLQNPVVTTPDPGSYPVGLTVTSGEGCSATINNVFTVFENPIAAFAPDPLFGSPPLLVNFINNSTGGNSYTWNFGDGNTGSGFTPSHNYQDTGNYQVTMIATSIEGCIDSTQNFVSVLVPYLDVAVSKVYVTQVGDLLGLTAEIINVGNIPVNKFDLGGIIENGSVIYEAWTGILPPGATIIYQFTARYEVNTKSLPGYYCVEVINPNDMTDQVQVNNNKCGIIGNTFDLYAAYPNPFIDQLSINFNLPSEGTYNILIFDAIGKLVYEVMNQSGLKGYNTISIPVLSLRKGIYTVKLEYGDDNKTIQIVKY